MLDSTFFDTLARQTAATVSRRNSLLALGGAGLAALAGSGVTTAKKKGKSKGKARRRARQLANRKCQGQVAPCVTATAQVNGNAGQIACCDEFLSDCDAAGFVSFLVARAG